MDSRFSDQIIIMMYSLYFSLLRSLFIFFAVSRVLLPTGPRASFGNSIDDELVPREPPFTAYVSNLPYEVEEDELCAFFKELQVSMSMQKKKYL